jgi:uncharacterized protein DUF4340
MNPKKLLLLVLVLLGLALALQQWSPAVDDPGAATEVDDATSVQNPSVSTLADRLDGALPQIRELTLHQTESLSILRFHPTDSEGWQMDDPIVDRAEPVLMDALLHLLFKAPTLEVGAAWQNSTDAELGLAKPRADLEIQFQDGSLDVLSLGAPDPDGTHHFASLNGQRLMVLRGAADLLLRPAEHWRDHAIFYWPQTVQSVRWAPQHGEGFVLQRNGSSWEILEPIQATLDPLRVKTLFRCLGSRVGSLPTDHTPLETRQSMLEHGDLLELTSNFKNRPPGVQSLRLYKGIAMDMNRPYLLAFSPEDFRLFNYTAEEIRSHRLVEFEPSHIASIRILKDSREYILRRSQSGWLDRQGQPLPAKAQKQLQTLLVYLATFEGHQLVQANADSGPRSILLSLASNPTPRGATMLRYWPVDAEHSALSAEGSRQKYQTERNLDLEWDQILGLQDQ